MELQKETIEKLHNGEITFGEVLNVTQRQEAALMSLGYSLYSAGRLEDATKILEGMASLDNRIAYVFGLLGAIFQKKQDYATSIDRYTEALKLEPNNIYYLTNRGEILLREGKFPQAASDLIKAIESDPEEKHPAANRARLLVALTQDAAKALKE
jgi:tetratricopeptide (TPR) repeat protein